MSRNEFDREHTTRAMSENHDDGDVDDDATDYETGDEEEDEEEEEGYRDNSVIRSRGRHPVPLPHSRQPPVGMKRDRSHAQDDLRAIEAEIASSLGISQQQLDAARAESEAFSQAVAAGDIVEGDGGEDDEVSRSDSDAGEGGDREEGLAPAAARDSLMESSGQSTGAVPAEGRQPPTVPWP